jgi:hypothetical protein
MRRKALLGIAALAMIAASASLFMPQSAFSIVNVTPYEADVNKSGAVDVIDLHLVARNIGRLAPTSTATPTASATASPAPPTPTATPTLTPISCTGGSANAIWTEGNGHCYRRFDTHKSWNEAQASCLADGHHLVTITSQPEQDFVWSAVGTIRAWIGLTDESAEGTWVWVTAEPFSYSNWGINQPDSFGVGEDHAEFGDASGFWNDNSINHASFRYICESP